VHLFTTTGTGQSDNGKLKLERKINGFLDIILGKKMKHNVRHQFYGHIAPHTVQHCRKEFQHKLDMSARQMDLAQVAPEIRIIDNNGKQ